MPCVSTFGQEKECFLLPSPVPAGLGLASVGDIPNSFKGTIRVNRGSPLKQPPFLDLYIYLLHKYLLHARPFKDKGDTVLAFKSMKVWWRKQAQCL